MNIDPDLNDLATVTSKKSHDCDVIIIGGGLVGGTLACALSHLGIRTIVVDTQALSEGLDAEFDGRASAIAFASQCLLESVGLWDLMEENACPIQDIRVSEGNSPFFLHYDHKDTESQAFGYMIENRSIRRALYKQISSLDAIKVVAPDRVKVLEHSGPGVRVELESGDIITAPLVVGADGRNSITRRNAGIRTTGWAYDQTGIVCTVEHEKSHQHIAHEHFLPAGPFAILPLWDNRASIVWAERSELAPAIMNLDETEFLEELKPRFGNFLGDLKVVGPRWSYPLSLKFAERAIDQRLALVGDALHGMHPIAGQGLNMGLRDVAALAEIIVDARRLGMDIGDTLVLERYQQWRRFDNSLMLAATDGLNRLFSNSIGPVRLARDFGLSTVNKMGPLKKIFMRSAMGLSGEIPKLMKRQPL
jgi:2-octaprenyl-6-methoxyphenol hydroxylase